MVYKNKVIQAEQRDGAPECTSVRLEWFKNRKSHQEWVSIFRECDHTTVSWAKKTKTVESFSTVTTGRVGTWFEGRDVGSVSFRLLVWGSAFIATHQKPALFSEGPFCVCACVCVHTVRVTLWVSHSPLIFFISLRFHSHSLGRTARYSTWIFCAETHKLRRRWLSHFKSFGRYSILGGDLLFMQAKHVQREKRYLQVHWGESFPWDLWRRSAFLAPLTSPGQCPWQR